MSGPFFFEIFMESTVYNSLATKVKKNLLDKQKEELFSLKDFISNKFVIHNEEELKKLFIKDLKHVLEKDNIFSLIQSFFDLETHLHLAIEKIDFDNTFINFDEFYKNLSPVFMRALLENSHQPENSAALLKSLREALRIALEEELVQLEE